MIRLSFGWCGARERFVLVEVVGGLAWLVDSESCHRFLLIRAPSP